MNNTKGEIPILSPAELYTKRKSRDSARLKTYNQILGNIHHRIRTISKMPNSECYVMYTIPQFIIGLPRIDLQDCVVYIVYQLRATGFNVRYTYPALMYISWEHNEKDYLATQNPIFRAMMNSTSSKQDSIPTAAVPKKKQKQISHNSSIISPWNLHNNIPVPKIPSAEEYIPPITFTQIIQY